MRIVVTGGAGFIGGALIRHLLSYTEHEVINVDKLTYAGNLDSLTDFSNNDRYNFERIDICSPEGIHNILEKYSPDGLMHLAAESHVDRSIEDPSSFLQTNIFGTYNLLEQTRRYLNNSDFKKQKSFRFHHISTDEVYGDLLSNEKAFKESSNYNPSSPYSASKASSDHLVRSWGRTFKVPFLITNTSNNYGPYHFPEKFIPHIIICALKGLSLPIYGDGSQIRDWLYVEDHVEALVKVFEEGKSYSTYNIGGNNQISNLEVVYQICELLEELKPHGNSSRTYEDLIEFVDDRPGHDKRYDIDTSFIKAELNWSPQENFQSGLRKTVLWYLDNEDWWQSVLSNDYLLERTGIDK